VQEDGGLLVLFSFQHRKGGVFWKGGLLFCFCFLQGGVFWRGGVFCGDFLGN
jgi:hypothetical protein